MYFEKKFDTIGITVLDPCSSF